jgi:hypothetical protein
MHDSARKTVVSGTYPNDKRIIHIPKFSDCFKVVIILYTCCEHDRDTKCKGQAIVISLLVITYPNLFISSTNKNNTCAIVTSQN